jgi:hypothetical protein
MTASDEARFIACPDLFACSGWAADTPGSPRG